MRACSVQLGVCELEWNTYILYSEYTLRTADWLLKKHEAVRDM